MDRARLWWGFGGVCGEAGREESKDEREERDERRWEDHPSIVESWRWWVRRRLAQLRGGAHYPLSRRPSACRYKLNGEDA